jgi:LPXTG-site transpeptidase (sortase) family protein
LTTAPSGPTARRRLARAVGAVLLAGCVVGCGATAEPGGTAPAADEPSSARAATPGEEPGPVPSARVGKPGRTERVTFVPESVVLPGGAQAPVQPARTVAGELKVPVDVQHVGWWDGSAYAGDPFGRTVIAGHVDSASGGDGFFARLERVEQGDMVTLRAGAHRLSYKITAKQVVARGALATDSQAFDQSGPHRLVLITCTGDYRRDRGGYESNLVVIGKPIGLAR